MLRLHSLPAASFYNARNSLSQRPPAPESIMTVEIDTAGMQAGDTAGLGLISTPYAWIGVVRFAATSDPRLEQRINSKRVSFSVSPSRSISAADVHCRDVDANALAHRST